MRNSKVMKLRVILAPDNIRKVDVENVTSVDQLKEILQNKFDLKNDFVIQFEDPEFGNEVCNLFSVTDLPKDKVVLHIIQKTVASDISSLDTASVSSQSSCGSSSSASIRQRENVQWPSIFIIPQFSYDVELRLEKANKDFIENGNLLLLMPREMKIDILDELAQTMFKFKAYPNAQEIEAVAVALIEKHPCLKDPGTGKGHRSWFMSLKYKMGNYRHKLSSAGCSEVIVNRKRQASDGERRIKKAKRCEVNFLPDNPTGLTDSSLEHEKDALKEEMKKKNPNKDLVNSKMELTFSLRRKEIVTKEPLVADLLEQWPALFLQEQICAEFFRITQKNLMCGFFASLDEYAPKMIKLYRVRSASCGKDMQKLLEEVDDKLTEVLAFRKSAALRGLPLIMKDEPRDFLKTCLDTEPEEQYLNGMKMGILSIVEDDDATVHSNPNARVHAVILEEQVIVDNVTIDKLRALTSAQTKPQPVSDPGLTPDPRASRKPERSKSTCEETSRIIKGLDQLLRVTCGGKTRTYCFCVKLKNSSHVTSPAHLLNTV
ncbi:hypothetical protein WMY93_031572, partial [Mugilogobius chulae]